MQRNSKNHCFMFIFSLFAIIFAFFVPVNNNVAVAENGKKLSNAKAMIVIEQSTGRVLYSENEHEKLPMASTTKIITAIYAIEHNADLDKDVEIPKQAVGISGTSIGLKEGEHLTVRELLYGLMLRSGNDCAVALAIETSGSVQKFAEDVNAFLKDLGLEESGLDRLVKASYKLLGLISYLTAGEKETRAWTIKEGTKAPQAAGKIHSDFERGFIKADIVDYKTLLECGNYTKAKEAGKVRSEGKEYVMKDGDVVLFKFNV